MDTKSIITTTFLLLFVTIHVNCQDADTSRKILYRLELSQLVSNSGFKSFPELYFLITPDHKINIGIGIYYCPETRKIAGFTVHHERLLLRYSPAKTPVIEPFLFYNFIYRKTRIPEVTDDANKVSKKVTYTSMEHSLGIGAKFNVYPNIYLKTQVGFGVYLGSIMRPSAPDAITGQIYGTNGCGLYFRAGAGYRFN